jgi:hypothetical protein
MGHRGASQLTERFGRQSAVHLERDFMRKKMLLAKAALFAASSKLCRAKKEISVGSGFEDDERVERDNVARSPDGVKSAQETRALPNIRRPAYGRTILTR